MPDKIMFIRHAEKPDETGTLLGVDETGRADPNHLSVRGWQRAGALVRFFAPVGQPLANGIATPSAIFACKPSNGANSVRPYYTVLPLAAALGITVNQEYAKCDDVHLFEAMQALSGIALVCWSHDPIPSIVRKISGELPGIPAKWPGKRYDLVWILERDGPGWSFSQVGQMLLPGDSGAV
jgi:broad specificity phosphatase PhoE